MITARSLIFAAMAAAPLYASPASAHVLLDLKEATVGGALRVAFQVPVCTENSIWRRRRERTGKLAA